MENLDSTQKMEQVDAEKNSGPIIIFIVTLILVVLALWQFSTEKAETSSLDESDAIKVAPVLAEPEQVPVQEEIITPIDLPVVEPVIEKITLHAPELVVTEVEQEEEPKEVVPELPAIDDSDDWLKGKLPDLTWRNELLPMLITEDIIRRFVVFTDNFAQGLIAYEHSVFIKPKERFTVDEKLPTVEGRTNVWQWSNKTTKRFDLYVDLLRSVDSNVLVDLYIKSKPLIDEAYNELGYEDDFTFTLQDAITRVLDMELPQSSMNITRTSVMYKYQDPVLEGLDDSDKLLLRLGKENLLIIKSVLLEINEKLTKRLDNNV